MPQPIRSTQWYLEAPNEWDPKFHKDYDSIFLAGGVSNSFDWQAHIFDLLVDTGAVIINPRRSPYPEGDPMAAQAQTEWEYRYMQRADAIIYWFTNETLCPITLYELGIWSMTDKPIAIGIEPGYARESEVRTHTALIRPDVVIVSELNELAEAAKKLI
jgi:hypothetical protein